MEMLKKYKAGRIPSMQVQRKVIRATAKNVGWSERMVYDYCLGGEETADPTVEQLTEEIMGYLE